MGPQHANQVFRDALGKDTDVEVTDADGTLKVSVQGQRTVQVDGYLAAYVPQEDAKVENSTAPSITGTARVGEELTANSGVWIPADASFSYQWLRNGEAIEGATAQKYVLAPADAGQQVSVRVTASKDGYTSATADAKAVKVSVTGGGASADNPADSTIGKDTTGAVAIDNRFDKHLASTGGDARAIVVFGGLGLLTVLAGAVLLSIRRRRRA